MKRKNVAGELVEAMREAAAIAQGEAAPAATHHILLPLEAEERAFWESPKNDSTEYVDWTKAKLVTFPKLRPSTETISLRMPEDVLNTIRNHARKLDVPYQSLIKLWVAEKAAEVARSSRTTGRGAR